MVVLQHELILPPNTAPPAQQQAARRVAGRRKQPAMNLSTVWSISIVIPGVEIVFPATVE